MEYGGDEQTDKTKIIGLVFSGLFTRNRGCNRGES